MVQPLRIVEHVEKGKRNRQARASYRRAQHGDAASAAGDHSVSFLEANTVRPPTADQYRRMVEDFEKYLGCRADRVVNLDGKLVKYLEATYFEGAGADEGGGLLAALEYEYPESTKRLPRARRALKGFRRLAPPQSRAPLVRDRFGAIDRDTAAN